jgi:hypothetical protein
MLRRALPYPSCLMMMVLACPVARTQGERERERERERKRGRERERITTDAEADTACPRKPFDALTAADATPLR